MSTDTPSAGADSEPMSEEALQERIEELEEQVASLETEVGDGQKKMTIVATQGTFDMAYPPLILASTAAAFGWDVVVFHTFWGLDILHEEKSSDLKLSAVGNPNMPMPNALAALPGMDRMATRMMEKRIDENGTATIEELIELSLDQGVDLQACQMTIELMEYDEDDFYDGVTTGVGAATALQHMAESDIQLLV
ncbi:DsrE/DsrF/DrsH-like family protein [Natrinema hispanicum]|uniref:Peroxiredoxin family protein n=1 Tax=Natrinema hispanicum TaxID=392421 RepID=A0A1I0C7B0_9EURY|nr:DsrE/DsrF/DrsH-like family protein [Natrinema hispanicum]SDD28375.1 Peroxiredoxin family protein [Natrinema hispanicum]SET15267.1 Peroxiredoxin family protein [Natrinema hispanicum]